MNAVMPTCWISSLILSMFYVVQHTAMDRVAYCLEIFSLLSVGTIIGGLASYPLASLSRGWLYTELLAADRALGLDWPAYWNFVQDRPTLFKTFGFAYSTIFLSPTILVTTLTATNRADKAYRFVAAFIVALFMTDLLFALVPGKSAAEHFLAVDALNAPTPGLMHIPIIERLRAGTFGPIDVGHLDGLIAFPSFHAAASILFAWAAWSIRWLRLPGLVLNVLMLASTPIQGGHYFVDTLAGIVVAGIAITLVRNLPATRAADVLAIRFLDRRRPGRRCEPADARILENT